MVLAPGRRIFRSALMSKVTELLKGTGVLKFYLHQVTHTLHPAMYIMLVFDIKKKSTI